ncbi:hypothetical protein JCM8547_005215 [Rhodosporidiobolus lusitaniae]
MQVHPSRQQHVPHDRPRADDLHSPPPHLRDRERRPSPSYDSYDRPPLQRDVGGDARYPPRDSGYGPRGGGRGGEDDRERRAMDYEHRRGGGQVRLTPERELGYGGQGGQGGYGPRGGYGGGGGGRGGPPEGRPGGRDDYFESRRKERERMPSNVWPLSPRTPEPESGDEGALKKKKSSKSSSSRHKSSSSRHKSSSSKKHRFSRRSSKYSDSSDSDTDSDRDRSSSRRHKSFRSSSSRHKSSSSSSRRDRDKERDHSRSRSPDRERSSRRKRSLSVLSEGAEDRSAKRQELVPAAGGAAGTNDDDEDAWVEKPAAVDLGALDGSDDEVGPMPLGATGKPGFGPGGYGGALRPGEGSAMAAYVQDGARIPRRGEIGMDAAKIEQYEAAGYVMSGSRHKKMNAVRVRKENQVISAEEKRGILQLAAAEKLKRENEIVASFRELVDEKLQRTE